MASIHLKAKVRKAGNYGKNLHAPIVLVSEIVAVYENMLFSRPSLLRAIESVKVDRQPL